MASTAPKLLTMPPEMRNRIYELVFATKPEEADLLNPMPPTKQLLLACAQIYHEARGLYNTARRSYWRETHFTVCKPSEARVDCVVDLTEEQLSAWVCTTASSLLSAGFRSPRVVMVSDRTIRLRAIRLPPPVSPILLQEAQSSTPRCVIGREELEVMLECKLKLGEATMNNGERGTGTKHRREASELQMRKDNACSGAKSCKSESVMELVGDRATALEL
ncbi:hypothetical protein LTR17_011184 [Elasticomyces elasticus]|nr:hypothetical protein LTR17_011184 [Elasticomyces elasticus]